MQFGVPAMSVSSGIQLQLDCDCSVCRTCTASVIIPFLKPSPGPPQVPQVSVSENFGVTV